MSNLNEGNKKKLIDPLIKESGFPLNNEQDRGQSYWNA